MKTTIQQNMEVVAKEYLRLNERVGHIAITVGDRFVQYSLDTRPDIRKAFEFKPEEMEGDCWDVCERLGWVDPIPEHPFSVPV